ncbi:TetR/AcrR family transcriptional regulator [Embleya sp. NBC_00888]|uniref:TetR/AcrR family transcriptional regulator n=1 Tax=Embleya sp. NBC_00888 TaxID=2975960 RepID=UPI003863FBB5|nr:TetR/AcrR family transcriptional regulator [Embleya sp. NBC_00888]
MTARSRARLLDEAERLFLTQGYDKVSVRAVNAAAGMNPAAVHYHFGSKRDLVVALLQERLGPLWAGPLAELDRARAAGWTPTVGEVVTIIVEPFDRLAREPNGPMLLQLLARTVLSGTELPWDDPWFRHGPWRELLAAARPDLSAREITDRWRLAFDLLLQLYGQPVADVFMAPPAAAAVAGFVTAGLDAPRAADPSTPGPSSPGPSRTARTERGAP